MRITLTDSPRHVAPVPMRGTIHMRVVSGTALLAREEQTLLSGGGLSVTSTDGIQSLVWDAGQLWMQGAAVVELVLPT